MADESRKNSILVVCCIVSIVLAGGIYVFAGRGAAENETADADNALIKLLCAACRATSDMPLAEYQDRVRGRSDATAKLVCPQCGAAQAWKVNEDSGMLPAPSAEAQAEALDSRKSGDFQAPATPSDDARPRKSAFKPARKPGS